MNEIILTCCGETVPSAGEEITCPACGTLLNEDRLEELVLQEFSQIPAVDTLRARNMLGLSDAEILRQRQLLEPIYGVLQLDVVFPITAIRRFATEHNMTIKPRPVENGVLWINKPALSSQK